MPDDTEETDRLAVLKHKFAVFRPDKSVLPRRRIKQMAKSQGSCTDILVCHDIRHALPVLLTHES